MSIKTIKVSNFKSFNKLELNLGDFNVFIGANASGKSNFIQIFRFLKDIVNSKLVNAISMQGGCEYLRNINLSPSENTYFEIIIDTQFGYGLSKDVLFKINNMKYRFRLDLQRKIVKVMQDEFVQKGVFVSRTKKSTKAISGEKELGPGKLSVYKKDAKVHIDLEKPDSVSQKMEDWIPLKYLREQKLENNTLLLERYFIFPPIIQDIFSEVAIFDIDPKLPKKSIPISGKIDLEEDGCNLSLVLNNIVSNKEKKRKFSNLMKDLLPFVKDVKVEQFADKSLLFKLHEKYFQNQYLPASLLSDGTINLTAMIIALYFQEEPLVIIEEPERNIHPGLISKVVDMIKDAARNKQVITTTHNPEGVKNAGIDTLFLVSRDMDGFTSISKPGDKEEVKVFLSNDLGIEDLYIQNLLEI